LASQSRAAAEAGFLDEIFPLVEDEVKRQIDSMQALDEDAVTEMVAAPTARPWPKSVPEQLSALKGLFEPSKPGLSVDLSCAQFKGARRDKVLQHLESLESLGLLTRYRVGKTDHWHA